MATFHGTGGEDAAEVERLQRQGPPPLQRIAALRTDGSDVRVKTFGDAFAGWVFLPA